ncbi:MAG: hypothetical protein KDA60_17260 [Planctomycetales bacterium]|nr:hypothetical protein [Planctomycetales bacterium]
MRQRLLLKMGCTGALAVVLGASCVFAKETTMRVTRVPAEAVAPGTVVNEEAPTGWTHLVLKTMPTLETGDVDDMSDSDKKYASLFHTVFVADIDRPGRNASHYRLARIGVGCSTDINGSDTVVCNKSHKRLNADLGWVAGMLLGEICKKQEAVTIVAQSASIGLVDTPMVVRWRDENQKMVYRYALLVDTETGALDTLVWLIQPDEKGSLDKAVGQIRWLEPNLVQHASLHVDRDKYRFGLPTELAFAVNRQLPADRTFDLPPGTARVLAKDAYQPDEVVEIERRLRVELANLRARNTQQASR